VMVLVTVWLVREPRKLALPNQSPNPPLVANEAEAPKPNSPSPTAEYGRKAVPSEPGSREGAPTDRVRALSRSRSAASKKVAPSTERADALAVVAPSGSEKERQSQPADSSIAARPSAGAAIDARDLKQSLRASERARVAGAGHAFEAQQNQASQSVTVEAQAQQQSSPSPQPSGAEVASGQTGVQAGGIGAPGAGTKAQAKTGPPPTAALAGAPQGRAMGGVAGGKASLDREPANKMKQDIPFDGNARLTTDSGTELQVLEERSTEKVIDTPIPTVKWRISAAGFVERSVDGGATWKGQEVDATGALLAGSAPDEKTCWVVGREGLVLVTKDAANWKKIPPPAPADLVAVSAEDASSATVTTADGRRFSTHNRGRKWKLEVKSGDANPQ
jgi:Photosynthesis system II assembly factor YCF48